MSSNVAFANKASSDVASTNHEPLKKSRILVVDIARGLSVIVMIMVHTLWMYGSELTQSESVIGDLLHLLGKGTAAFLVLMGFSMALSSRNTAFGLISRGVLLLAVAYALNFLKFIVPITLFQTMPESFVQAYQWQSPLNITQYVYLLLTGDILQMAAITLIIMGIFNKWLSSNSFIIVFGLLIIALSGELRGATLDINGLGYLVSLFWSDNYQVYFPVFPWMACVLFGRLFGNLFVQRQHDQGYTFKMMAITGAGLIACGVGLIAINTEYHFNNFFHLGPGGALYLIGLNGVGIWLLFHLIKIFPDNKFNQLLCWCSVRVTSLYVLQWTLVCWGMGVIGFKTLSPEQLMLMLPIMIVLTLTVHYLLEKGIQFSRQIIRNKMQADNCSDRLNAS